MSELSASRVEQVLRESVEAVLEQMFFIQCLEPPSAAVWGPELAAHLAFEGDLSGHLSLRFTAAVARSVAADFLGTEAFELSERQIEDVLCELANMICGSVLSRLESSATFRLSAPSIVTCDSLLAGPGDSVHAVQIDSGRLMVTLHAETPAWQPVAE